MLPRLQIEARVLAAYDSVRAGHRVEDSLMELKSDWPDPQKAARRIAAHANAARGEAITWVVGLDEETGYTSCVAPDTAAWWPQVQSHFDGNSPSLFDFAVQTDEGPLWALHFDTSLGPFVVRNPVFGRNGAGPVEREVPWRDGTRVRSATREDLVRMLVPLQHLPAIEVLGASIRLTEQDARSESYGAEIPPSESVPHLIWNIELEMYVAPQLGTIAILPVHRTGVAFSIDDGASTTVRDERPRYYTPSKPTGSMNYASDSVSIETTGSEAVVHLPGRLHYRTTHIEPARDVVDAPTARLVYWVTPMHTEHSVRLELELAKTEPLYREKMWWELRPI